MGDAKSEVVHFVLVPLMAQGHMIPTIDLGRLLAQLGMQVTLITTPLNIIRYQLSVDRIRSSGLPMDFVPIRFPASEAGIPDGFENIDSWPFPFEIKDYYEALYMMAAPLEAYIREEGKKKPGIPICLISDFSNPWTSRVSENLGIPRYVFYSVCCFTLNLVKLFELDGGGGGNTVYVVLDLDERVEVPRPEQHIFLSGSEQECIRSAIMDSDKAADGIIVNSVYELEPMFVDRFSKLTGKKIWTVGPVSLCNKEKLDKAIRGSKSSSEFDKIQHFLDSMNPKSVVYFSLGSLMQPSLVLLKEIGKGLEASGHPFIWVLRGAVKELEEIDEWLETEGLEARTRNRSLILRGWAPQLMILEHGSTGAFFTHCGWNSCLEGIATGVPLITWPCFVDQFSNQSFIVDVVKIGVSIGIKEVIYLKNPDDAWVKSETIKTAVERVLNGGDEGDGLRKRIARLTDTAKIAFDVGGSSYQNLTLFSKQEFMDHTVRTQKE